MVGGGGELVVRYGTLMIGRVMAIAWLPLGWKKYRFITHRAAIFSLRYLPMRTTTVINTKSKTRLTLSLKFFIFRYIFGYFFWYHRFYLLVCLLGNLISISDESNSFLRWLQSLAAYLRNTRKRKEGLLYHSGLLRCFPFLYPFTSIHLVHHILRSLWHWAPGSL